MIAKKIGVVAPLEDLHAQAVRHIAEKNGNCIFHFCSDAVSDLPSTARFGCEERMPSQLIDSTGTQHSIDEFSTLWWRRPYAAQRVIELAHSSRDESEVINNSARLHLEGLFRTGFRGRFINDPSAAQRAEHKLVQLHSAEAIGLRIPQTISTNDYDVVQSFFEQVAGDAIVKSHFNSATLQIKTSRLTRDMLANEASVRISPCIYQKFIPGTEHLRVVALKDRHQAVRFLSDEVDSRIDLSHRATPYILDANLEHKVFALLNELNLDFGVLDFKRDVSGALYFLEINQQGQFAFLDAVAGTSCLPMVTEFLLSSGPRDHAHT